MAEELTLAFSLAALRRVADPAAAVADARSWSAAVGVVTDRPPHVLTKFTRDHGIQQAFEPDPAPAAETLAHVRHHHETDRHLFVGAGAADRATAAETDWEFLDVTAAADAAGWTLAERGAGDAHTRVETSTDDWP